MATKIAYDQFGPAFIKEGLHPFIIQKSLNKAIQPRHMSGTVPQKGVTVTYIADIQDVQVAYTQQIGVYDVVIPINLDVDVRAVGIISKRYQLKAIVPFQLIVETYAPLLIFINYTPVQTSRVNVNGPASGGDIVYKQIVGAIPEVLAAEVNKALANSYNSRMIDVLAAIKKAMQSNTLGTFSVKTAEDSIDLSAKELQPFFENAPENFDEGDGEAPEALFNSDAWIDMPQPAAGFSISASRGPKMDYRRFGLEFVRLSVSPQNIQKKINDSLKDNNIKADIELDKLGRGFYKATIHPASVTSNAFGQYNVILRLSIQLYVQVLNAWNEDWKIEVAVSFSMQAVPYSNPLLIYLFTPAVQKQNISVVSKQQSMTGIAWGSVESKIYESLQKEVNDALNKSHKDRSINILESIKKSV